MINPEFVERDGMQLEEEGCLSIPGFNATVVRPARAVVTGLDRQERPLTIEGTGLLARAFQHEIDHLHGKLFIDYLSFLKRRGVMARWEDLKEKYPGQRRILTASMAAERTSGDESQ